MVAESTHTNHRSPDTARTADYGGSPVTDNYVPEGPNGGLKWGSTDLPHHLGCQRPCEKHHRLGRAQQLRPSQTTALGRHFAAHRGTVLVSTPEPPPPQQRPLTGFVMWHNESKYGHCHAHRNHSEYTFPQEIHGVTASSITLFANNFSFFVIALNAALHIFKPEVCRGILFDIFDIPNVGDQICRSHRTAAAPNLRAGGGQGKSSITSAGEQQRAQGVCPPLPIQSIPVGSQ